MKEVWDNMDISIVVVFFHLIFILSDGRLRSGPSLFESSLVAQKRPSECQPPLLYQFQAVQFTHPPCVF